MPRARPPGALFGNVTFRMVNGTFTAFKMWNFLPGDGGKTAFLAVAGRADN